MVGSGEGSRRNLGALPGAAAYYQNARAAKKNSRLSDRSPRERVGQPGSRSLYISGVLARSVSLGVLGFCLAPFSGAGNRTQTYIHTGRCVQGDTVDVFPSVTAFLRGGGLGPLRIVLKICLRRKTDVYVCIYLVIISKGQEKLAMTMKIITNQAK